MAKPKKAPSSLIRSDKNLLALGLFGAALLIGVFVYFDYKPMTQHQYVPVESERTYRVETAPATLNNEESSSSSTNPSFQEDTADPQADY